LSIELETLLPRLMRRWWVVVGFAALALLGAALTLSGGANRHERTIHLVLRPDSSVSSRLLPGALEVLKSDGALVQTVIGALSSEEMLRRAGAAARVRLAPGYTITSAARPGSALIDSTVAGPDAAVVDRLGGGFVRVASDYVAASYSAYALDPLGSDPGGQDTRLSRGQVVVLALLLGGALGVGVVLVELRLEARPAAERRPGAAPVREPISPARIPPDEPPTPVWTDKDARCLALTSKGAPCRNRRVDDRGYCRQHLARMEAERARVSWENGSAALIRLTGPAGAPGDALRPGDRPRPRTPHEDEG
jgi:hypothetical protein